GKKGGRMYPPDDLSRALLDLIEEARTSSESLAKDANLGKDTVGRWIRGEATPNHRSLCAVEKRLSKVLKRPVDLRSELSARKRGSHVSELPKRPLRGSE